LPKNAAVRSFEVDSPRTQAAKRGALGKAGIDSNAVAFVAADFECEDWYSKLAGAGFDPSRKSLFLWEGVTLYLERKAVEDVLRRMAGSAKGSLIAFDYFTDVPLHSPAPYWRYARAGTRAAGEPMRFGLDSAPPVRERLAEFLRPFGLSLAEHRALGKDTEKERAWGGFAVAVVE
jgi:methyltransferase (TIGR00027 family)